MRVYFLSCTPAILKLNGLYAGYVDLFERHIDVDFDDGILAEVVPGDNLQPASFFLDNKILTEPPDFMDVYLLEGDALIYIRRFSPRDTRLNLIYQTRFEGNLVTVFSQGEIYLAIEGEEYSLTPVGGKFTSVRAEQKQLAGMPVLALYGGDALILISHKGRQIYANEPKFAEFGTTFKVGVRFETATCAEAHCEYSYDGENLTLVSSRTVEKNTPDGRILHFAFFESVMTYGDYSRYLSPDLTERAAEIKEYLGNYSGVTVPTEKFYMTHPDEQAAGLVYPEKKNLFKIKYFAVRLRDGKIDNIYPVD